MIFRNHFLFMMTASLTDINTEPCSYFMIL